MIRRPDDSTDNAVPIKPTTCNLPDAQCSHPVPLLHGVNPRSSRRPSDAEQRMNSGSCRLSPEASFRTDDFVSEVIRTRTVLINAKFRQPPLRHQRAHMYINSFFEMGDGIGVFAVSKEEEP